MIHRYLMHITQRAKLHDGMDFDYENEQVWTLGEEGNSPTCEDHLKPDCCYLSDLSSA